MLNAKKAKELFEKNQKILVVLHQFPDGDTISSSLALSVYLKRQGKKVDLAVKEEIPEVFHFLTNGIKIRDDFLLGDYDLIIAVDCGDAQRTGFPARLEQISRIKPLINIDHHLKNSLHKIATLNMIDTEASAAAEIVWDLLNYLEAEIDSKIATYILAGIYYDTGGFQHANVTAKTLKIASQCLRRGGRIGLISKNNITSKSPSGLKLWGIALNRVRINANGIVSTYITLNDIKKSGAKSDDTSGIVNLINTIPNSKIAILFVETPDGTIKTSLRTERNDIDVSVLARLFGGGGHKKAAGFTLESNLKSKIMA
ncbi:MAG: bifunctional oligoribonuclease/PAP phosphatase NrnA [Candidatus Berkelbacteria bacterium]|nr:bifunctional oligoribonuclease/PAP phosphatase NrnA [Candidatus Berkelbacteria bacterium]